MLFIKKYVLFLQYFTYLIPGFIFISSLVFLLKYAQLSKHTNTKNCHCKETDYAKKCYQRIVLEGHTLGMHSYSHNYDQIYSSLEAFKKDINKLQNYLYETTETKPFIYRFPGGSSNSCVKNIDSYIRYINQRGWFYFDWNALSGDALNFDTSAQQLNQNILKDVRRQDVSIVLMHDLHETEHTVEALDSLIKTLKKEGYQILPITENTKPVQHKSVDK